MEFLNISLTKVSSLLPHAIHSPFYWRILKKPIFSSGFKNPLIKNPRYKKTRLIFSSVEKQTKTRVWENWSLRPETSIKNVVQEFPFRDTYRKGVGSSEVKLYLYDYVDKKKNLGSVTPAQYLDNKSKVWTLAQHQLKSRFFLVAQIEILPSGSSRDSS
jgi:hypothetical protein